MTFTTAAELAKQVRSGSVSAVDALEESLQTIADRDSDIHAFVTVESERARRRAQQIDADIARGEDAGPLAGVPVALKDNMCMRGVRTTCSSKILENWHPPYDATVVERLHSAGAVIVGKTNLDEFAMGSSTEHSAFGPTRNPHCTDRVPGGSSGGSSAAVAAGMVSLALGSDTGGSIRQPAAFCGVVGMKPTYGAVSRYGLIAFASSLDQIGPFSRTVEDSALLFEVIAGHDPRDSTSLDRPSPHLRQMCDREIDGIRVGLVTDLVDGADPEVKESVTRAADALSGLGAKVEEISIPEMSLGLPAYYLIAPAEASSNLSRYDGVRYGLRVPGHDVEEMNRATRAKGFGPEVKRRIMLGTFALSSGYYDAYYGQAQRVRTIIIRALDAAYQKVDVLLGATTPTPAFELGAKLGDPLSMYLSDLFTVPSNLAGHPAISVPFGKAANGMPIGVQVLAPALGESVMYQVAGAVERAAASISGMGGPEESPS
ncbi:MAG: Asp-tRNA(Asn)/Glu-tRNA(Gln) amidotransferase subunit GatA [Acidimicrobiales bacterium]|jgi:aspartyl-tRNA(Asn)/glutamyl-tRNA(Gln) amidotransferase subunit A